MTRIALIDGHPDRGRDHFDHALGDSYAEGAAEGLHELRRIFTADLQFPLLRSMEEWQSGAVPPDIARCQETIAWAEHLVFVYPLWLGDMPALLKGFLEQVARPGFAFRYGKGVPEKLLKGKSARIIVTMGMPGILYRLFYRAHSLKSFERNILQFVGIGPIRSTVIGSIEADPDRRQQWLDEVRSLGVEAE